MWNSKASQLLKALWNTSYLGKGTWICLGIFSKITYRKFSEGTWDLVGKKKENSFVTIFQRVSKDCFLSILFVWRKLKSKKNKIRSTLNVLSLIVKKFLFIGWVPKSSLKLTTLSNLFIFLGCYNQNTIYNFYVQTSL